MYWQYLPILGFGVLILLLAIRSAVKKSRDRKNRAFARRLETVLQPKETVKVTCCHRSDHWILTNKRLLHDGPDGMTAIPLTSIKRVQGVTKEGKTTVSPGKMEKIIVKADKEHTIYNRSQEFEELAKQLRNKANQNKKAPSSKK